MRWINITQVLKGPSLYWAMTGRVLKPLLTSLVNKRERMTTVSELQLPFLDSNPAVISAFAYTNVSLLLSVPNTLVPILASNRSLAMHWVHIHVLPFQYLNNFRRRRFRRFFSSALCRTFIYLSQIWEYTVYLSPRRSLSLTSSLRRRRNWTNQRRLISRRFCNSLKKQTHLC